ncbi:MAG TPA: putative lipid II flippase FtsW [Vicinamibacterales bacterium]|nr:putative lipid II flippase FtsW [Vicinamibacterales bacterium]
MARTLKSDKTLFLSTLLLVGMSVVMVYSASAVQAVGKGHSAAFFLFKQVAWAVIGVLLMLGAMRIDYHEYRRPALIWSLLGVTVMGLLAVFLFPKINGTHRWLSLLGLSLQPSEVAKLVIIFFTAAVLERRMHRVNDVSYTLLPIAVVTVVVAALIYKEPDFGTTVVLVLVVGALLFSAGLSYRLLIGAILVLLPAGAVMIATAGYRMDRLLAFLDPGKYALTAGFQLNQSLIAIGSGGMLGKGLMAGVQKLFLLPEPHTDFIYAVVGEELGLIGTTLILVAFLAIAWRGLRAALVAPDRFGSLLALGITTMVACQALVNISVVIGLFPTKGIPLPLVSNGGSSLLINMAAMGILLNISQQASPVAAAAVDAASGELVNV